VPLPGRYIGLRFISEDKHKEVPKMLCPVCNVDLLLSDKQGIEIDYCPKCRGIWLDRGELDKLIERSAAPENQRREYREAPVHRETPVHYDRQPEYHEEHHKPHGQHRHKKRKSFLGEIFDFD
jgi:uncharacterized protein